MTSTQSIKILIAEDNPADAELLIRQLRRSGYEPVSQCVETETDYISGLTEDLDLVISDYQMPHFTGLRALEILQARGWETSFIIVSGTIGEEMAVEAMRLGATDYLLKDRMARLGPAVARALEAGRLHRERSKAVAELRLFRHFVDQSNDAFEVLEPSTGAFVDVNEKGVADLGYTRAEFLALRVFDIDPMVTEAAWLGICEKVRREGSLRQESSHRRKDGSHFPVEVNARWVPLDRDYIVAVVRDISLRQRSEEALRVSEQRFRTTLERLIEGCQIIGRDWRILYINDVAARHGRQSAADLTGRSMLESFPGIEASAMFSTLRECMENGQPRQMDNKFFYDNGDFAWFQLVIQPVPEGLFVLSLDITERKRAELEIGVQLGELQRWQDITLEREDRVLSLKSEVNEALALLEQPPRYASETI